MGSGVEHATVLVWWTGCGPSMGSMFRVSVPCFNVEDLPRDMTMGSAHVPWPSTLGSSRMLALHVFRCDQIIPPMWLPVCAALPIWCDKISHYLISWRLLPVLLLNGLRTFPGRSAELGSQ